MARYRKIDVRIHSDAKFRTLSDPQPCGKYLWLYLLTGPQTGPIPGLYRVSEATLADELGWDLKAFREAFREVLAKGLAKANLKAKLVWLPNALKYNLPASPNVIKSWSDTWDELPECDLKTEAYYAFKAFLEGYSKAFGKAFRDACGKPLANQEQEQEQEQEIKPMSKSADAAVDHVGAIFEIWAHYRTYHPSAAKELKSGRKEYRHLKARLEEFDVDQLKRCIDGYEKSPFHCGDNDRGTKYLSAELFFRTASNVQRGIEFANGDGTIARGRTPQPLPALAESKPRDIEQTQQEGFT